MGGKKKKKKKENKKQKAGPRDLERFSKEGSNFGASLDSSSVLELKFPLLFLFLFLSSPLGRNLINVGEKQRGAALPPPRLCSLSQARLRRNILQQYIQPALDPVDAVQFSNLAQREKAFTGKGKLRRRENGTTRVRLKYKVKIRSGDPCRKYECCFALSDKVSWKNIERGIAASVNR